jgi:hypothetical protein
MAALATTDLSKLLIGLIGEPPQRGYIPDVRANCLGSSAEGADHLCRLL